MDGIEMPKGISYEINADVLEMYYTDDQQMGKTFLGLIPNSTEHMRTFVKGWDGRDEILRRCVR